MDDHWLMPHPFTTLEAMVDVIILIAKSATYWPSLTVIHRNVPFPFQVGCL